MNSEQHMQECPQVSILSTTRRSHWWSNTNQGKKLQYEIHGWFYLWYLSLTDHFHWLISRDIGWKKSLNLSKIVSVFLVSKLSLILVNSLSKVFLTPKRNFVGWILAGLPSGLGLSLDTNNSLGFLNFPALLAVTGLEQQELK